MIKLEIKYVDGTILKREFKNVDKAVEWLKKKTNKYGGKR